MYTQRIAIPVETNVLTLDLEKTTKFHFFDVDGTEIVKETVVDFPADQKASMPAWLFSQEVHEIITGQIDQPIIDSFLNAKVSVVMGAPAMDPRALTEDYLRQLEMHHNHGGCGCHSEDSCETDGGGCGCH
jgi:predicted Fe-Mo cluster-binding NifX family protein